MFYYTVRGKTPNVAKCSLCSADCACVSQFRYQLPLSCFDHPWAIGLYCIALEITPQWSVYSDLCGICLTNFTLASIKCEDLMCRAISLSLSLSPSLAIHTYCYSSVPLWNCIINPFMETSGYVHTILTFIQNKSILCALYNLVFKHLFRDEKAVFGSKWKIFWPHGNTAIVNIHRVFSMEQRKLLWNKGHNTK